MSDELNVSLFPSQLAGFSAKVVVPTPPTALVMFAPTLLSSAVSSPMRDRMSAGQRLGLRLPGGPLRGVTDHAGISVTESTLTHPEPGIVGIFNDAHHFALCDTDVTGTLPGNVRCLPQVIGGTGHHGLVDMSAVA